MLHNFTFSPHRVEVHKQAELDRLGKRYEVNIYDGAGHGFLGRQSGQDGANQAASEGAWPATISFFRELLED